MESGQKFRHFGSKSLINFISQAIKKKNSSGCRKRMEKKVSEHKFKVMRIFYALVLVDFIE